MRGCMGAIKDLTDLTVKLIDSAKDRKFAGELREIQRMVAALQSEHADIHEKRIALMAENAELKQRIGTLQTELAASRQKLTAQQQQADEFVEHRGALFKSKADGGFHNAVYCPSCKRPAGHLNRRMPFTCSCGWIATFNAIALPRILEELGSQRKAHDHPATVL
jgi:hypothetical protein